MVGDTYELFEPDAIVPSQFFATQRRQAQSKRGEYRLLVALLEDAINCFQGNARAANMSKQRLFEEAQGWIMGGDGDAVTQAEDQVRGFSFEYVCAVLGLDAAYLRWGLCSSCARATVRSRTPNT
jgi:hypothetical protein